MNLQSRYRVNEIATPNQNKREKLFHDCILYAFLLILGAYLIVSAIKPEQMDSDLIVPTIASLKNPSLFYWGQDRLLSLTTFLLIPFRFINLNLYLNVFIQALFFAGLMLFFIHSFYRSRRSLVFSYVASMCLILLLIPENDLFTFAKHAQPYASSTLSIFGSFAIYKRGKKSKYYILSACLMLISFLLNPLSVFLALALPLSSYITNKALITNHKKNHINISYWILTVFASVLATLVCKTIYSLENVVSSTPSGISIDNITNAIPLVYSSLSESFSNSLSLWIILLALIIFISGTLMLLPVFTPSGLEGKNSRSLKSLFLFDTNEWKIYCLSITFNLLTLIPIASSEWVKLNGYSLRYFFPIYLSIFFSIIILTCVVISLISKYLKPRYCENIFSLSCGFALALILGYSKPIAPSILQYSEISRVEPIYEFIASNLPENLYLGGNYWLCWPIKVWSIANKLELGVLTDRSHFDPVSLQMTKNIEDKINQHENFTYYCISENIHLTDDCFWGKLHHIGVNKENNNRWTFHKTTIYKSEINGQSYLHEIDFTYT